MGDVNFKFFESENLVVGHASGLIKDSVFKESIQKIFSSDKLTDGYKGLLDTRMVSGLDGPSSDAI